MSKERRTQAVIVIHGIGEQKPMDTLRGFVDAVLPDPKSGEKYFSKPDPMSERFELRKLQNRKQPRTHFFEYYWADKVQGTTIAHVRSWLASLLLRLPWRVPKQLRLLWSITWLLILLIAALIASGVMENLPAVWFFAVGTVVMGAVQFMVVHYVGDAARYLSPHPKNIAMRRSIRADGVSLLRKIHESGDYKRVVVVGHSLGSVIAYDIIKHLWQQYYDGYLNAHPNKQEALTEAEKAGEELSEDKKSDDFQAKQVRLWQELRGLGHPWLITDLITLGSPLSHASILLAKDEAELRERQQQRELPICPPSPEIEIRKGREERRYSFELWDPFVKKDGGKFNLRVLHHAAHFACTRWTNLYFPARLGIFGDFIGGPLRRLFGFGIRDVPVKISKWGGLANHLPFVHTSYWWAGKKDEKEKKSPGYSLRELIKSLDLDGKKTFADDEAE